MNFLSDFENSIRHQKPLKQKIIPVAHLSEEQAVGVYQEAYVARLTESLMKNFETFHKMIGDEKFFKVSFEFIQLNDSTHHDLSMLGEKFLNFVLRKFPSPLRDLALFDWNFLEVFHFEKDESLNLIQLIESSERVVLKKNHRMLVSNINCLEIWKNRNQSTPPDLTKQFNAYFFSKSDQVMIETFNEKEFSILLNLISNSTENFCSDLNEEKIQFVGKFQNSLLFCGEQKISLN